MGTSADRRPTLRARIAAGLRAAATYDFFPAFSARVRRLFGNPFGVLLLAAAAALLCGLFLHPQGLVLFGGVLAVLLLGVLWPWVNLRGLRGTISFERLRAVEGEAVEVTLTLRSRLPWSAWGLAVRGGFGGRAAEDGREAVLVSIAATPRRRAARCRWVFVPACRGVYPLAAPLLTTGFPFGLWENRRALAVETPLLVWPRTFPVGPVPLAGDDGHAEGNVARNKVGSSGDVLGVRPYRRGDSPRRIHWAQTARHDRLIVCELQSNARPLVQLVLDAEIRVHRGAAPDGSREWAIRIVASMAQGWLEEGAEVGAVWNGEAIPAAAGRKQIGRLLDGLARLPETPGPSLAEVLASPACRGFTDGLQVVVTTDAALAGASPPRPDEERQRWVVLRGEGFTAASELCAPVVRGRVRPWLWIDSPETVPALLRGGWKEARHGS